MSRAYDVTFSTPDGYKTVRGFGNTRRVARSSACWHLKNDHKINPRECDIIAVDFVPEDKR